MASCKEPGCQRERYRTEYSDAPGEYHEHPRCQPHHVEHVSRLEPAMLTLIRCGGYEEREEANVVAQHAEDEADRTLALDVPDRLAADCDRCREPQTTGLTMSGGDAVCDVCIRSELAEEPETSGEQ